MKGELRNRRRQFWAMLLAVVMVVGLMPYGGVKATTYKAGDKATTFDADMNVEFKDVIQHSKVDDASGGANGLYIYYYDLDGATKFDADVHLTLANSQTTIKSYEELKNPGTAAPESSDYRWIATYTARSEDEPIVEANVKLTAFPKNCYITFDVQGHGSITSSTQKVAYNGTVTEPSLLSEIGYTFGGWYREAGCSTPWDFTNDKVTSNRTLYAKWTPKTYDVIYNVNANGPDPSQATVNSDTNKTYGTDSVNLVVLTDKNDDYEFLGWSKNQASTTPGFTGYTSLTALVDGTEPENTDTKRITITLYGVWKAKPQYSLNYDKGSATSGSAPATETKSAGKTTQIAGNTGSLSKVGYKLLKWNTATDGSGTDYQFGATFTFAENPGTITLYPVWEGKKYNIKFKVNAKGPNPSQSDVNDENGKVYGTDSVNLISLTDQNNEYEFLGWSPDSTGNTGLLGDTSLAAFINGSENLDATTGNYEVTLYGIWKAKNKYTLTYDKGDAVSGTVPDAVTKAIGNTSVISGNTGNLVKAAGYHLEKWNTKADATGADYGFGTTFTFSDAAGNVTLYPVWKINAYSVSFDKKAAEASGSMTNQNFEYGTAQILTANAFTRDGYTFAGWSTTATGAVEYTDGQSVNNLTDSQDGVVTLYAVWTQSNTGNGGESGNGGGGTVPSPTPDPTPIITSEPVVSTTPTPTPETTPTPTVTPSVTPTPTPEVTPTPGAIVTQTPAQETKFSTVLARLVKIKKTSITVKWKKQKDVDGYEVYGVKCNAKGMKNKHILLATLGPDANSFKAKNLEKNTYYKFYVDAYKYIDGEKVIVSRSAYLHGTTLSKKYGMASGVKLYVVDEEGNKTEVTGGHVSMKLGDVMQLLGVEQNDSGKKIKHHRGVRYEAKIEEIADVNYKKGLVEATQVGTTEIYAFAQNGVFAKIVLEVYDEE